MREFLVLGLGLSMQGCSDARVSGRLRSFGCRVWGLGIWASGMQGCLGRLMEFIV